MSRLARFSFTSIDYLRKVATPHFQSRRRIRFQDGKHRIADAASNFEDGALFDLRQFWELGEKPVTVFEESVLMNAVKLVPLLIGFAS